MRITLEQFKKLFPNAVKMPETYTTLSDEMAAQGIVSEKCQNYFLAQLAHECVGFRYIYELGSKSYFNRYEGRKSLGNTQKGDGYKFRGRGWIQLTGRYNYTDYGKKLGIDLVANPDVVAEPPVAAKVACRYWMDRNLNAKAEAGDLKGVTKAINGGLNGYADRATWLGKIRAVPTLPAPVPKAPIELRQLLESGDTLAFDKVLITEQDLVEIVNKKGA